MSLADFRSRPAGEGLLVTRHVMEAGEAPRGVEIFSAPVEPRLIARWDPPDDDPGLGLDLTSASSLLVSLRPGIDASAAESVLRNSVLPERPEDERLRVTPLVPVGTHLIEWEPDLSPAAGVGTPPDFLLARAARLAAEEVVDDVELDHFLSKIPLAPITQLLSSLPEPQGELKQMGVPEVWDQKIVGSEGVRVAVVDSGVDASHEALRDNIYRKDGKISGWGSGRDFTDFTDDNGHGTFCAGLIGSRGGHGVNRIVSIIPVKFLNVRGFGTAGKALAGIRFALAEGAKVISCSWGSTTYSRKLRRAIQEANEAGALVVAGAGNSQRNLDTHPFYPAAYPLANVISVGACDDHDVPTRFWGYGKTRVHLTAPGATVYSTTFGNGSTQKGGTSASAAFVAGACALLMAAEPQLTHLEVRERIIQSVKKLQGPPGEVNRSCCTKGRLDVANAILHKRLDTTLSCP